MWRIHGSCRKVALSMSGRVSRAGMLRFMVDTRECVRPAWVHCIEPTGDARQTQVNSASIRTCALHRADRRRAPDVNQLSVNLHMCIAPGRRTTRNNRKPNPHQTRACALYRANGRRATIASQTRACALHRANRRRAANASQLCINPHMRVAPSRYAARGKRKSTPHQPAHARCTEPTGGAHQT